MQSKQLVFKERQTILRHKEIDQITVYNTIQNKTS